MPGRGFFITFEGCEGAGKSTQIALLAERLRAAGRRCSVSREPGGTPLAEKLRELVKHFRSGETVTAETELLLMEAARSQHVENRIRPALERGEVVLCDRFYDSTTAYQGYGRGMDLDFVHRLNAAAVAGCRPNLTLLLDLPLDCGFTRAGARPETRGAFDRFESEKRAFFENVRTGFLAIAAAEPARVKIIDADADKDTVAQRVFEVVNAAL